MQPQTLTAVCESFGLSGEATVLVEARHVVRMLDPGHAQARTLSPHVRAMMLVGVSDDLTTLIEATHFADDLDNHDPSTAAGRDESRSARRAARTVLARVNLLLALASRHDRRAVAQISRALGRNAPNGLALRALRRALAVWRAALLRLAWGPSRAALSARPPLRDVASRHLACIARALPDRAPPRQSASAPDSSTHRAATTSPARHSLGLSSHPLDSPLEGRGRPSRNGRPREQRAAVPMLPFAPVGGSRT
jgi:hypothetical protein